MTMDDIPLFGKIYQVKSLGYLSLISFQPKLYSLYDLTYTHFYFLYDKSSNVRD